MEKFVYEPLCLYTGSTLHSGFMLFRRGCHGPQGKKHALYRYYAEGKQDQFCKNLIHVAQPRARYHRAHHSSLHTNQINKPGPLNHLCKGKWKVLLAKEQQLRLPASTHSGLTRTFSYADVNDATWSSTTFLIFASISGVTLPVSISSNRGPCVDVKCERNSASQRVIWSTGMGSNYW